MKNYSLDFRQRVMAHKEKHQLTFQQTSDLFSVSLRSLFRWEHKIEPCITRNKPATKVDMDKLQEDVKTHPDAYQYERAQRLGVSQSAIHYALKRLKITCKKNAKASKS